MFENKPKRRHKEQPLFHTGKLLLTTLLGFLLYPAQASEELDNQLILSQFQEPFKTQARQVIRLVISHHPGRIINVQKFSKQPEAYYRVKMINDAGYMKVYYIDQRIEQVNP